MPSDQSRDGNPSEPITVQTTDGKATFYRVNDRHTAFELEYRVDDLEAELRGRDLEEGIAELRDEEIAIMRKVVSELGELLGARVRDNGVNTSVSRDWKTADTREWHDRGSAVAIPPSRWRMSEISAHSPDISEAEWVQKTVQLVIEQREQNIRSLYRQVLTDIRARRGRSVEVLPMNGDAIKN